MKSIGMVGFRFYPPVLSLSLLELIKCQIIPHDDFPDVLASRCMLFITASHRVPTCAGYAVYALHYCNSLSAIFGCSILTRLLPPSLVKYSYNNVRCDMPDWLNAVKGHVARMDSQAARPRWATVTSFDPDTHSARLRIEPEGIDVGWTPVSAVSVGQGIGMVAPPAQGDQVLVEPVEGSGSGWAVMGRFFSTQNAPPVSPATEMAVQPNEIALVSSGAIIHLVGDTVHIHASTIKSKGKWEHDGDLETTGDVKAQTVSLLNHTHDGPPPNR